MSVIYIIRALEPICIQNERLNIIRTPISCTNNSYNTDKLIFQLTVARMYIYYDKFCAVRLNIHHIKDTAVPNHILGVFCT